MNQMTNPSLIPAFWSAIAASFAGLSSFLAMRIQRRNLLDSARPEIVLTGWSRTYVGNVQSGHEVIGIKKIKNVGRGPALHVYMNATRIKNNLPIHTSSSTRIAIIAPNEEIDLGAEISIWWKNGLDFPGGKMIPIQISIMCWDSKSIRHITRYNLYAGEKDTHIFTGASLAENLSLSHRTTESRSVFSIKVFTQLSKLPVIGKTFKKKIEIDPENDQ